MNAILTHLQQDEGLADIMGTLPVPDIPSTKNVFHDLLSCVIEQQIHYRSTKRQFARLLEKAALTELTLENFAQFEEQALSSAKLSPRKWETLAAVLDYFQTTQLDWASLSDETVREELGGIKGIGPWTVDMILLYTLQRPDVFPAQDYHLKQLMTQLYVLDSGGLGKKMQQIAKNWEPFRSYGVLYLFAWKDQQRKIRK